MQPTPAFGGSTFLSIHIAVLGHKWLFFLKSLSHVRLFATTLTVACQAPQFMEFSRQEDWSGLPFPSPGDLPNPGIEPETPALQADALPSEPPGKPNKWHTSPQMESLA